MPMIKIPEDIQKQLQEAANASQRQQESRDRMLAQILEQLVKLNASLDEILADE